MKIILYMAMSVNGFIADQQGNEDFLSDENWQSLIELSQQYDSVIIGRKTYEKVLTWPDYNLNDLQTETKIVISKKNDYQLELGYILAKSPQDAILKLKQAKQKSALLVGGSNLNAAFLQQSLVNEIILNIEPVLVGQGIPLLAANQLEQELELIGFKKINKQILQLKYRIL